MSDHAQPAQDLEELYHLYVTHPQVAPPPNLIAAHPDLFRDFFYDANAAVFHLLTYNLRAPVTKERWLAITDEIATSVPVSGQEGELSRSGKPGTLAWWFADGAKAKGVPPDVVPLLRACFFAGALAALKIMTEDRLDVPTESGMRSLARQLDGYLKTRKESNTPPET